VQVAAGVEAPASIIIPRFLRLDELSFPHSSCVPRFPVVLQANASSSAPPTHADLRSETDAIEAPCSSFPSVCHCFGPTVRH
jgi:hypothetical protein